MPSNASVDYAYFVEFADRKFRLEATSDLRKSRVYNSEWCLHAEVWHCPYNLGKNVIGIARKSKHLIKQSRTTFRSSRTQIRIALNEAKWTIYKPLLSSLLGHSPYSTLNTGPISFGHTQVEICPLKAARIGIQFGIHPEALFAGKTGLTKIHEMIKKGDTITFFNETSADQRLVSNDDLETLNALADASSSAAISSFIN